MCTLRKLKKLVKVLDAAKEKSPEMLYPGDFVLYKPDGEMWMVCVRWDNDRRVYKWNLVSLNSGLFMDGVLFDDWVSSTGYHGVLKDEFIEDNDPDWEVINLREDTEGE